METVDSSRVLTGAIRRVRRTLDDAGASLVGRRVLALCSGGADSIALVTVLAAMPRGAAPAALDVLFFDHGLRDVSEERTHARAAADAVGATFLERRANGALCDEEGGLEAAARTWRYAQAGEIAAERGADVVATGHTASDQLETALLALIGVTGRSGGVDAMPVRRPLAAGLELVRPLLGLTRAEVEAVCAAAARAWGEDPSNRDTDAHVRNAIRHEVVPALLAAHPTAGSALRRAGERARDQHAATPALAEALLDAWGATDTLDVRTLAQLPLAARREVVAAWLRANELGRGLTARAVAAVDALATRPARAACARADLASGACVRRDGYHLRIQPAPRHGGPNP